MGFDSRKPVPLCIVRMKYDEEGRREGRREGGREGGKEGGKTGWQDGNGRTFAETAK